MAEVRQPDIERWRELACRALEPNPFFEPEFVLPAAARLDSSTAALIVVAEPDGDWVACLPVLPTARWKRLPVAVLAAWRHLYCFLGTPLVAPGQPEEAMAQLVDQGLGSEFRPRMLVLDWLRADGPLAAALGSVIDNRRGRTLRFEAFERAALERRDEPDYLQHTLRPHHRRELRRLARRLAEEMGAPLEVRDVSHDPAMIDRFIELEAAGWKGRLGTAFGSQPGHAQLFREVSDSFRAAGRLQLLALMAGERPAALKCNLLAGDEVFGFKIAYDESLARFSPGFQLEERMVSVFHEQMSERRMDSCAASDNDMINRLWPDRRPLISYAIPSRRASGWASMRGVEAAFQVHNRLRKAS
jgi:CelD/BcsL family acetyltransferase involved in cellulose biosynthesis